MKRTLLFIFLFLSLVLVRFCYSADTYLKDDNSVDNRIMDMRHRLKDDPNNPIYLYNLGFGYYACELYDDAVEPLEKAKTLQPEAFDTRFALGAVYFELHRYPEAKKEFKEAIALKPKDIDSHVALTRVYWRIGDKNRYAEQLNRVKEISYKRADALKKEREEEEYERKKEYNLELSSESTKRAAYLIKVREYLKAKDEAKKAIDYNPYNAVAYYNLGLALSHLGQQHRPLALYKEAISLDPRFVDAYINMGKIYHAIDRNEDAISVLEKAISINPNIPEAYTALGLAYKDIGQVKKGEVNLTKGAELLKRRREVEETNKIKRLPRKGVGFCGDSTYGRCSSDVDCKRSGCSSEVCQSKYEEEIITPCIWKGCYNAKAYNLKCKCVVDKCQWSK